MTVAGLRADDLMADTREIARGVRTSGSADEARAFDYIESILGGLGFAIERHAADALIGYPRHARIEVLAPERLTITAIGYALSPSTPPDGVAGDLCFVGAGSPADFGRHELRGKVALSLGAGSPPKAVAADAAGLIAHVHIDDRYGHEMCVSPVWGSPTPATAGRLPATPAVGVRAADGERLRALLSRGPVSVRVVSDVYRGWRPIPILTADLAGDGDDTFVLFSGHVDSWYHGAMDNASANAVQLGAGRLLAGRRRDLRRGLRLAFWSGHSHGRYAGSTWYADHRWQELYDRCVCHVNVDSPGAVGATLLSEAQTMAETFPYAARILREQTGVELGYHRITRAGDQSFWGIGVPSMFMLLSEHRVGDAETVEPFSAASPGKHGANPWWWHTPDDTMDKIDPAYLLRDASIYAEAVRGLCTERVLPFDYGAAARELRDNLRTYGAVFDGHVDLGDLAVEAEELATAIDAWQASDVPPSRRNPKLMALGRALIPVTYTKAGPFGQDPALRTSPLPGIAQGMALARMDRGSEAWQFLRVDMIRERNRVRAAMRSAARALGAA